MAVEFRKAPKQPPSQVDEFIRIFNISIDRNEYSLNTGLPSKTGEFIPTLSDSDFNIASKRALAMCYILSRHEDNYNTITYKLIY